MGMHYGVSEVLICQVRSWCGKFHHVSDIHTPHGHCLQTKSSFVRNCFCLNMFNTGKILSDLFKTMYIDIMFKIAERKNGLK